MKISFALQSKQLIALISLLIISSSAQAEPASTQSIREYLRLSGIEAYTIEKAKRMLPMFKQMAKNMPEDLWAKLSRTDNLIDKIIPTYQKYLTENEVQDLISFYKTPTGMQFAKVSGTIDQEITERGAREAQMIITNYYIQMEQFSVESK